MSQLDDELELYLDELATQHPGQTRMLEILSRINALMLTDPPLVQHTLEKKYDAEYEHQLLEKLRAVESLRQRLQQQNEVSLKQMQSFYSELIKLLENICLWYYIAEAQERFILKEQQELALANQRTVAQEKKLHHLQHDKAMPQPQHAPLSPPIPAPRLELFAMKKRLYPY